MDGACICGEQEGAPYEVFDERCGFPRRERLADRGKRLLPDLKEELQAALEFQGNHASMAEDER